MATALPTTVAYKDTTLTKHGTYSFRSGNIGGYDVDFVNGINKDYECPICHFTFRDPVQTRDCGHRFCETCLEPILRKPPSTCPIDRRVLTRDKFKRKPARSKSYDSSTSKVYHYVDNGVNNKYDRRLQNWGGFSEAYAYSSDKEKFTKSNPLFEADLSNGYHKATPNVMDYVVDTIYTESEKFNKNHILNKGFFFHGNNNNYAFSHGQNHSYSDSDLKKSGVDNGMLNEEDIMDLKASLDLLDNLNTDDDDAEAHSFGSRESISYWGSSESLGNISFKNAKFVEGNRARSPGVKRSKRRKYKYSSTGVKNLKEDITELDGQKLEMHEANKKENSTKEEESNEEDKYENSWPQSSFKLLKSMPPTSSPRILMKIQSPVTSGTEEMFFKMEKTLSDLESNVNRALDSEINDDFQQTKLSTKSVSNRMRVNSDLCNSALYPRQSQQQKKPSDENDFSQSPQIHRFSQASVIRRKDGQFTLKNSSRKSLLPFSTHSRSTHFFRKYSSPAPPQRGDIEQPPTDIQKLCEEHNARDKNMVDAYLNDLGAEMGTDAHFITSEEQIKILEFLLFEEDDAMEVFPDRACKRTILAFQVRCYNYGSDCEWTGELGNLQDHLEQCQLIEVPCVNACGRTDIPRNQMNQHVDADGDCPLAFVACRYNDVGCRFKARRVDMEEHLRTCTEEHLKFAHIRIRELEIRQETICMNGKFLWKISNYDLLMKQSATKKDKEKLCSLPFYTGQYGYKLRAEAFLNGLGQGKGSHLSLYVVIMKGEYDAILPWPFKQNVDFVLIDQDDEVNNRVNKIWKLSCERNSDYFKRPNKSKSLGFGCPKFVSLETLKTRNYIKDQTLFIKIEVEPTDCLIFSPQSTIH